MFHENVKKHCHKECFYNLGEENFLKVTAYNVIFPTSITVLFEIHQRFKGHFLTELRVSLKHNSSPVIEKSH